MTSTDIKALNNELNNIREYIKWVGLKKPDDIVGMGLLKYLQLRRDTIEQKLARYKERMG